MAGKGRVQAGTSGGNFLVETRRTVASIQGGMPQVKRSVLKNNPDHSLAGAFILCEITVKNRLHENYSPNNA